MNQNRKKKIINPGFKNKPENYFIEEKWQGRKEILPIFEKVYRITTWPGVLYYINKNKLPLRRTGSGKPFFYKFELIKHEFRFQELLSKK